jgi:eukaryotic-like serine/threonine-protein kinase
LDVGTVIAGKYQVDRVLGHGGMGLVVAAQHLHLQQPVALKFLTGAAARDPSVLERFLREARAQALLRGEHVCKVSDVGALDNGAPYIVMELLDGHDLASVLVGHGRLAVPVAVDYVMQACVGVAEAHAMGVVHRDLKPANLFLTRRPDGTALIKVLDFGIAKAQLAAGPSAQLTQTQVVLGSPHYMAPEQLRNSRAASVRSDVWSLGVILYELVSGTRPFDGELVTEIALAVALQPPPLLTVSMPKGFQEVLERCLDKDPAKRYPHLGALADALAPFGLPHAKEQAAAVARVLDVRERVTPAAMPAAVVPATVLPSPPTTMRSAASAIDIPAQRASRWKSVAISGGVALAILAAVGIGYVSRGSTTPAASAVIVREPPPPPPPAPPAPAPAPAPVAPPPAPVIVAPAPVEKTVKKPSKKKSATTAPKPPEEDLGASRM